MFLPLQTLFSFTLLQTNIIIHTIRLILCFQQDRWDWQPHCTIGAKYCVALCAGSMLLLTPVVRTANISGINLQIDSLSPTGLIKHWFLTEGKLPAVLIIPPLGVSQQSPSTSSKNFWRHPRVRAIKNFWRRCRGGRRFLQGQSLTSNLFTLFLFCLVYFILSCLLLYIKNTKKLVPIIAVIFVSLFLSC